MQHKIFPVSSNRKSTCDLIKSSTDQGTERVRNLGLNDFGIAVTLVL